MLPTLLLSLTLSVLASALPALPSRSDSTCTTPKSFTISRFSTFTPSAGNPQPAQIYFLYGDDSGTVPLTTCYYQGGSETTSVPVNCADADVKFTFKGELLTVWEGFTACDAQKKQVSGTTNVGYYCYPSPAAVPLGLGTSCQSPSVSFGGVLA